MERFPPNVVRTYLYLEKTKLSMCSKAAVESAYFLLLGS